MKHMLHLSALAIGLAVSVAYAAQSSPAAVLFHEGLMLERAQGKLQDAIFRYERVIAEFPSDREIVPQVLYHLALTYETKRDPRAAVLLARLVTDFPTATPFAADARKKLLASQAGTASGPFKTRVLDPDFELGSPDGRFVIYYKWTGEEPRRRPIPERLMIRDLKSGSERVLLEGDAVVSNFSWSPDSRQLAFNARKPTENLNDIRVVTIATGEVRSLSVRGYPSGWTTRGDLMMYRPNPAAGSVDLFLLSASGGEPRKIYAVGPGEGAGLAIVPDGKSLITARSKRLVVRDLESGKEYPLTGGSADEMRPIVSPDSRLVAFLSNRDGDWALYVAPLARDSGRAPVRIGAAGEMALPNGLWWTDDGLVTLRLRRTQRNVYRIAVDPKTGQATAPPERLTQDARENFMPAVSPDNKHIAYYYFSGSRRGIAVMDAQGLNERPLIEQDGANAFDWRSNDEILFRDFAAPIGTKPRIRALNTKTGAVQDFATVDGVYWRLVPGRNELLHAYPGAGGSSPGAELKAYSLVDRKDRVVAKIDFLLPQFVPSPDGKRIAFATAKTAGTPSAPACDVSLMAIDGAFEKTLVSQASGCVWPASWSPDGRYLLLGGDGGGPTVVDVETNKSWPLHTGAGASDFGAGTWSPDGSFVTLTHTVQRTERVTFDGVTFEAVNRLLARTGAK